MRGLRFHCSVAVGRVSRPRSSTCTLSLSSITSISLPSCMTFACTFSCFFFNFQVAWSGVRTVSFTCSVSQLSWKGRDGWLPSLGFPQGPVVLCVPDSADRSVADVVHALKGSSVFCSVNGEIWMAVALVVPSAPEHELL